MFDYIQATSLYLQGVKCEQNGDMLEAIRHYKQAIKLVPNIEELVYAARVAPGWYIHLKLPFTMLLQPFFS